MDAVPGDPDRHHRAVGIGFARFLGLFVPQVSESNYIIPPVHVSSGYAFSLSTAQLVCILLIAFLTWTNSRGLQYGKSCRTFSPPRKWARCSD